MATSDQDNENEPEELSKDDRIEEIKKEAKEDASSYYAQQKEDKPNMEEEFKKPVTEVDKEEEDLSLVKAMAFLGFGMAAFAIVVLFFFFTDLDERVGGVDNAVNKLEETIAPLKKEMNSKLDQVQSDVAGLKAQVGDYERMIAVKELKQALVTVEEMNVAASPEVKMRSAQVVASINSLLRELGENTPGAKQPAGTLTMKEAPAESAPEPAPEPAAAPEEPAAEASADPEATEELPTVEELLTEEPAEEEAEAAAEEPAEEEAEAASEEPSEEEAGDDAEESGDEEEEEEEE